MLHTADTARRTTILSFVVAILFVVLVAATWFAYPILRDERKAEAELNNLRSVQNTLGERVASAESRLDKTAAGIPALESRVDDLQSTINDAQTEAEAAAAELARRTRQDLGKDIGAVESRLSGVESNQRESIEVVNQLRDEIAGLKTQIAQMHEESSVSSEKIRQLQDELRVRANTLAALDRASASHQAAINALANRTDLKRIDFDLELRRTQEIFPGMFLRIGRADVGKQEVDATLQLGAESRMLPISRQGIQKPIIFHTAGDNRPIEVVFTQVAKTGASGYIMLPVAPSEEAQ
jgi:TolA-binding protein